MNIILNMIINKFSLSSSGLKEYNFRDTSKNPPTDPAEALYTLVVCLEF